MDDALVTQAEAARLLHTSRQYIRYLILRGKLRSVTVAGRPHVLRESLQHFLKDPETR